MLEVLEREEVVEDWDVLRVVGRIVVGKEGNLGRVVVREDCWEIRRRERGMEGWEVRRSVWKDGIV